MTEIKINDDGTIEKVKKADIVKDIKTSKMFALTPEQRQFLIRDIKINQNLKFNPKHLVMLYLMIYAGLRRGEVVQVRKSWLSKSRLIINGVERDLLLIDIPYRTNDIRKGKGKFIWKAKTRKSQRVTIVFDEHVSTYIEAYYESNPTGVQCSTDYIYKVVASDKRYSFRSRIVNCEEKTNEGNDLIIDIEKERLSNLIPHSLRSTYAYVCKELGLDNEQIAELLGHDDVKTLKQSYFQNTRQSLVLSISQSLR
ncbi:MAG: site-specific integrase [Candidatus Woesearchaeota archaeon]|jgi:integrase|nr:site-specific integrase [Candidatus Woesearchaeota archaeon]